MVVPWLQATTGTEVRRVTPGSERQLTEQTRGRC